MATEDPVASLFGRYFTVRADKRKIDHSWGVGELEHAQRDEVIEYLQMPERVKKVKQRFEVFSAKFDRFAEALRRLLDLEGRDARSIQEGHGSMKDYVS